jgi:DNA-binding NtrC family response regulator
MQTSPAAGTTERQIFNIQEMLRTLEIDAHQAGLGYDFLLMAAKRQFIIGALERNKWNQSKAARALSLHRNTLSRTMAELKIADPNKRKESQRVDYRQRVVVKAGERFPTI